MEQNIIEIIAITVDNGKNKIAAVNAIENIELIRCLGHTIDVIDFWRQYEQKFSLLSQEAKRIFFAQGACTASESDFSASGYTVLNRRNALLPRKVYIMMVLQQFNTNIERLNKLNRLKY